MIFTKCKICGKERNRKIENFIYDGHRKCSICIIRTIKKKSAPFEKFWDRCKEIHGDEYTYISGYETPSSYITLLCNNCKNEIIQRAQFHLNGNKCKKCSDAKSASLRRTSVLEIENRCNRIHNNKFTYFQDYAGIEKEMTILCNKCQLIFLKRADCHMNGVGCPKCDLRNSNGEQIIADWLDRNNISYIREKTYEECKLIRKLRFDFYLPNYNTCIEYDGKQHFCITSWTKNSHKLYENMAKDKIKNDFCKNNNINLIRIAYINKDNINSILDNKLTENILNKTSFEGGPMCTTCTNSIDVYPTPEVTLTPWGYFVTHHTSPDESVCFKTLVINYNQQISLQKHYKRSEFWYISDINARFDFTLGDKTEMICGKFKTEIPVETIHCIKNLNEKPLIIHEMQYGICKNEDILRIFDPYERHL